MIALEIVAIIFSLASVILATEKSIITWTTGIIGCAAYSIIFYKENLMANFLLQFIFIFQSILGYKAWQLKQKKTTFISRIVEVYFFILLFVGTYYMMLKTEGVFPFLDSLATVLSISAMYYMARKKTFSWILWMIADLVYAIIFSISNLTLSFLLYIVFFVLAYRGYKIWKLEERKQTNNYVI